MDHETKTFVLACSGLTLVVAIIAVPMWLWPKYRVYSQEMEGRAVLKKAEHERQVLVEQARAEKEAAELRAEAIRIVGEAAAKYPEYRQQEFMGAFAEALKTESIEKIIFVPTEANVPIIQPVSK